MTLFHPVNWNVRLFVNRMTKKNSIFHSWPRVIDAYTSTARYFPCSRFVVAPGPTVGCAWPSSSFFSLTALQMRCQQTRRIPPVKWNSFSFHFVNIVSLFDGSSAAVDIVYKKKNVRRAFCLVSEKKEKNTFPFLHIIKSRSFSMLLAADGADRARGGLFNVVLLSM